MSFDSVPEVVRDVWLHTVKGWVVALRVPGKPFPMLPGCDRRGGVPGAGLVRAVYEQTGLVITAAGGELYKHVTTSAAFDSEVVAGSLRASSAGVPTLVHPREFTGSMEALWLEEFGVDLDPEPLRLEKIAVRPEDIMPGDRTNLVVSGFRYEQTSTGALVFLQYESFAQSTLGADDELFGDDTTTPKQEDDTKAQGRKGSQRIGDAALGRAWSIPLELGGAGMLVYRLGGSLLGAST